MAKRRPEFIATLFQPILTYIASICSLTAICELTYIMLNAFICQCIVYIYFQMNSVVKCNVALPELGARTSEDRALCNEPGINMHDSSMWIRMCNIIYNQLQPPTCTAPYIYEPVGGRGYSLHAHSFISLLATFPFQFYADIIKNVHVAVDTYPPSSPPPPPPPPHTHLAGDSCPEACPATSSDRCTCHF